MSDFEDVERLDDLATPVIAEEAVGLRHNGLSLPRWARAVGIAGVFAVAALAPVQDVGPVVLQQRAEAQTVRIIQLSQSIDAGRLGPFGCSTFVIRDPITEVAVGEETAEHCGLYNYSQAPSYGTPWITGSGGRKYIVSPAGELTAYIGSDSKDLKPIGVATDVLVDPSGGNDAALVVFQGHTPTEVLRDYDEELMPETALGQLIVGKSELYVSGWPVQQNGDAHGNPERQDFKALYLGTTTLTTQADKPEQVLLLAFPLNADGATCTPGISGSVAFNVSTTGANAKAGIVGPVSAGWSGAYLTPGVKAQYPEVDWTKYGSVCGIALRPLSASNVVDLHVVNEATAIPGPLVNSDIIGEQLFFEPDYQPTVVNGDLIAVQEAEVNGQLTEVTTYYKNPVLFMNPDGSVAVGWYDTASGGLRVTVYDDLSELAFYSDSGSSQPALQKAKSMDFVNAGQGSPTYGAFETANGYQFGMRYTPSARAPMPGGQTYGLVQNQDGSYSLQPLK
jgi:hypothetical protein